MSTLVDFIIWPGYGLLHRDGGVITNVSLIVFSVLFHLADFCFVFELGGSLNFLKNVFMTCST